MINEERDCIGADPGAHHFVDNRLELDPVYGHNDRLLKVQLRPVLHMQVEEEEASFACDFLKLQRRTSFCYTAALLQEEARLIGKGRRRLVASAEVADASDWWGRL